MIKRLGAFFVVIFVFLIFILYDIYIENKQKKEYKTVFYKTLNKEQFYFIGKVISSKEMAYGDGFLCLEKISTNKPSGYYFKVNENYVASVYRNTIKFIGSISFSNELGKLEKIKEGDSIAYNVNFNNKVELYRNSKLLLENEAYVYKVYYNNKHKDLNCEKDF